MVVTTLAVIIICLMLLFILLLILFFFKPWRFFFSSRNRAIKDGELDRPLVPDGEDFNSQSNELSRDYDVEGAYFHNEGHGRSPHSEGLVYKPRHTSGSPHITQGDSLIVDIIPDHAEDISIGKTLKPSTERLAEAQNHAIEEKEDQGPHSKPHPETSIAQEFVPRITPGQGSCLYLEVRSGPSRGLHYSVRSTNSSKLPLTLGRVSSDLLFKDSEVSGKHAMIKWNPDKKKWELIDMGSLNGTLLNSQPINHPDSGSRNWGEPVELSNGDIITLGTMSNVYVHVTSTSESQTPFTIGMASDPMALRRGGRKLPMEDVCFYQWPLPGIDQFGVFGICDGHGGVAAANSASQLLLKEVATVLSDSLLRERVLSQCDASDVLRVAFSQTEASMHNHYEGCTATVLLVWFDGHHKFFVQCANVGDSACVLNVDGRQIKMTEDHRIVSPSEKLRFSEMGKPIKDGETRLCGLNLARMLGDKFLKQQDERFSSAPYISQPMHIDQASGAFALLASDGFWDVVSVRKAVQVVLQTKERHSENEDNLADKVACNLLNEAKAQRTKDNTSIIFLDFDCKSKLTDCKVAY